MNAGLLEDVPIEDARHQLDVMLLAPARLAQLVLPGMRRRGGGRIVVISSPLGEANLPFQGWYGACKRALGALTDALRVEVVDDAVDVVLIEPGAADTPLWDKARAELADRRERSTRPDRYDRAIVLLDEARSRAADPAEVAATVGEALHAAHPRYRYRTPHRCPAVRLGSPPRPDERPRPGGPGRERPVSGDRGATVGRTLDAPPEAVAMVLADPRAYDGIVVGSRRIRWFDPRWPEPGSRFHHTLGLGPLTVRDHSEVVAEDLPRSLRLLVHVGPFGSAEVVFRLTPEGDRTHVAVDRDPHVGGAGPVVVPTGDGPDPLAQRAGAGPARRARPGPRPDGGAGLPTGTGRPRAMTSAADAVVVGAGPNGLVAANLLADAGWDVLVLEAQDEPGGAVRTAEVTAPGFRNDLYSAFYPLALPPAPLAALGPRVPRPALGAGAGGGRAPPARRPRRGPAPVA